MPVTPNLSDKAPRLHDVCQSPMNLCCWSPEMNRCRTQRHVYPHDQYNSNTFSSCDKPDVNPDNALTSPPRSEGGTLIPKWGAPLQLSTSLTLFRTAPVLVEIQSLLSGSLICSPASTVQHDVLHVVVPRVQWHSLCKSDHAENSTHKLDLCDYCVQSITRNQSCEW